MTAISEFNMDRALLDSAEFPAFQVNDTVPLREAIANRQVKMETSLIIRPHAKEPLGVLLSQMAYHHVAQGVVAGEPWLISY